MKRPPRQVWFVWRSEEDDAFLDGPFPTKKVASSTIIFKEDKVVGPYVLAERVRQK